MRRSSWRARADIAEDGRKGRFERQFISTLNIVEAEAAETQAWLDFSRDCGYIGLPEAEDLCEQYDQALSQLVHLINNPRSWLLNKP